MAGVPIVDLEGGSIAQGLLSYGAPLGLEEITAEASTNDGVAPAPLIDSVPSLVGGDKYLARAIDGLKFETRDALSVRMFIFTSDLHSPMLLQDCLPGWCHFCCVFPKASHVLKWIECCVLSGLV